MPRASRNGRTRLPFDIFDGELGVLGLFSQPARKRTNTRKSNPKNPKNTNNASTDNSSIIVLDDSDDECLSTVMSRSRILNENASNKVDNFFKSSGLLSDDEDDISLPRIQSSKTITNNSCGNHSNHQNVDGSAPSSSFNEICSTNEVIVSDDEKNEISTIEDIKNYCKETEDILRNANALLDKFAGTKSQEEPEQPTPTVTESSTNKEKQPQEKGLGECPICYENFSEKQVMTTKCGHLFCKVCIDKIATTVKKCPTCRKAVNKKNIIAIYI